MQLAGALAEARREAASEEAAALRGDVGALRAEVLRLAEDNKRLQSTPKAGHSLLCCPIITHTD